MQCCSVQQVTEVSWSPGVYASAGTSVEERGVQSIAMAVALNFFLPRLGALRGVRMRHVPRQHGASAQATHAPSVSEGLAVVQQAAGVFAATSAAVEVIGGITIEVAAQAAQAAAKLCWHRYLEKAHAIPQQL